MICINNHVKSIVTVSGILIAVLLVNVVDIEAVSHRHRLQHRLKVQNGTLTPITPVVNNNTNTTVVRAVVPQLSPTNISWPIDPVTNQRYDGIKEFAIVLHDNIEYEKQEMAAWFQSEMSQFNATLSRLKALRNNQSMELLPLNARLAKINTRLAAINQTVTALRVQLAQRNNSLQHVIQSFNSTDFNWNSTIASLSTQRDLVQDAVNDVDKIFPLLTGPNPTKTVAERLLQTAQKASSDKKAASLLQLALEQTKSINGVKEITDMLNKLKTQLSTHLQSIVEDLSLAQRSREQHLQILQRKLTPYLQKVSMLQDAVVSNFEAVPILQRKIAKIRAAKNVIKAKIQKTNNDIQRVKDQRADVRKTYAEEMENIKLRDSTIEEIHQVVKARLLDGTIADKTLLKSVKNVLVPRGPSMLLWNPYYATTYANSNVMGPNNSTQILGQIPINTNTPYGYIIPKSLDSNDASAQLCANWRFDERSGDRYAIDSGPHGFDGRLHGSNFMRSVRGNDGTGSAIEFDGMQEYVDVGRLANVGATLGSFSIELWVRTIDTHPALSSILKYIDDGLAGVLAIEPNRRVGRQMNGVFPTGQQASTDLDFEEGTLLCYLRDSKGKVLAGHVKAPLFDNKWHRLQWIVMNATENRMAFYMDGLMYPWITTIEQSPDTFQPLKRNLFIGAGNNRGTPEGFFDGSIDNVRFFCNANITQIKAPCCRSCNNTQVKACGDMCIPLNETCRVPRGCACDVAAAHVTNATATPAPTAIPTQQPQPLIHPTKRESLFSTK